jgi:hypothetical protein
MEDNINIDLKEVMEEVHAYISGVEPRESAIQQLAVISLYSGCNWYVNIYLSPVLLQT